MRPLFDPLPKRISPAARQTLENSVQDAVRVDEGTLSHAAVNVVAAELDSLLGRFTRMDPRPWEADLRVPGALRPAEGEPETTETDLFYGPPRRFEPAYRRFYVYGHSGASGIVNDNGQLVRPAGIDAAVETTEGLFVQVGPRVFRFEEGNPFPQEESVPETGRVTLVSGGRERWFTLRGRAAENVEIAARVEGLDIVLEANGHVEVTLEYTGAARVTEGQDVTQLTDYERALHLYDSAGNRRAYTVDPIDGTLSAHAIIEEGAGPKGNGLLLYYAAGATYQRAASGTTRISFAEKAEHMADLPTAKNLTAIEKTDVLFERPAETDAYGSVAGVLTNHPVRCALPGRHHTMVADDHEISVVEMGSREVVFQQGVPNHTIVGLTWTKDAELAMVTAVGDGFEIWALRPVRNGRVGNYAAARPSDYA